MEWKKYGRDNDQNCPKVLTPKEISKKRTPRSIKRKNKLPQPRHIIFKPLKTKNRRKLLMAARDKRNFTHKGTKTEKQQISHQKLCNLEGNGVASIKCLKRKVSPEF